MTFDIAPGSGVGICSSCGEEAGPGVSVPWSEHRLGVCASCAEGMDEEERERELDRLAGGESVPLFTPAPAIQPRQMGFSGMAQAGWSGL